MTETPKRRSFDREKRKKKGFFQKSFLVFWGENFRFNWFRLTWWIHNPTRLTRIHLFLLYLFTILSRFSLAAINGQLDQKLQQQQQLLFSSLFAVVCVCVEGATCSACVACLTGWPNALNRPRRIKNIYIRKERERERVYSIRMSVCIFPASKVNAKKKTWIKPKREKNEKTKKKTVFFPQKEGGKRRRGFSLCVKGSTAKRVSLFSCRNPEAGAWPWCWDGRTDGIPLCDLNVLYCVDDIYVHY